MAGILENSPHYISLGCSTSDDASDALNHFSPAMFVQSQTDYVLSCYYIKGNVPKWRYKAKCFSQQCHIALLKLSGYSKRLPVSKPPRKLTKRREHGMGEDTHRSSWLCSTTKHTNTHTSVHWEGLKTLHRHTHK